MESNQATRRPRNSSAVVLCGLKKPRKTWQSFGFDGAPNEKSHTNEQILQRVLKISSRKTKHKNGTAPRSESIDREMGIVTQHENLRGIADREPPR
jgi:hypothetical protein